MDFIDPVYSVTISFMENILSVHTGASIFHPTHPSVSLTVVFPFFYFILGIYCQLLQSLWSCRWV